MGGVAGRRLGMRVVAMAVLAAVIACVDAHVALRYPKAKLSNDFLDNGRTKGLCGLMASGADHSSQWELPAVDNTTVTSFQAGAVVNVEWDLHYAHQGGWVMELFNASQTMLYRWDSTTHWGNSCSFDGTIQAASLTMPAQPCTNCFLRLERKALEWGASYAFTSCAAVDIVTGAASGELSCNGCSGKGTCSGGACVCDHSPEKGYFYGAHCERENECDTDSDCGSHGACIDVGDITGPTKQCFCESGFWGDEKRTPSGLTRRWCDRPSQLTLGDPTTWASDYNRTEKSPQSTFQLYYNIVGDEIEVAMSATTTSWVGFGFRALTAAPPASAAPPTRPAAPSSSEPSSSEPTPSASEPRRRLRSTSEPTSSEPASSEPETSATSEAATSSCPPLQASAQPLAATSDVGRAVNATEAAALVAAYVGTTSEGEPEAPSSEPGAPSSEPGAPSSEPAGRRRRLASLLPPLEAHALRASTARQSMPSRSLQQTGSEPEPTTQPSSEPATGGAPPAAVATFGDGACKKILNNASPPSHPMDNQDIVMATARVVNGKQYIRVQDMFTPSRSKPMPDAVFGGTDDIIDAAGQETASGTTLVKFRRKLQTGDASVADYCILPGFLYEAVWAYGQLTANARHVPNSTLEIIGSSRTMNHDFYKPDEFKFHGGGISIGSFEGRGVLNTFDFFAQPASGSDCQPSPLSGYDCVVAALNGQLNLHYTKATASTSGVKMAAQSSSGMVAVAFPSSPGVMIGSTAVIGFVSGSPNAGVYSLTGKSVPQVVEVAPLPGRRLAQAPNAVAASISGVSVDSTGGVTTLSFTRATGPGFNPTALVEMLVALSPAPALGYHGADRTSLQVSLTGGSATAAGAPEDLWPYRRAHAWLMLAGWGLLIPLAVIIARTLKDQDPLWFLLHRVCNILGLLLATAGFIIALVKFNQSSRHKDLGIAVMVLGWIQPFNAVLRPAKAAPGQLPSKLRSLWEVAHWTIGRAALVCAFWNIFWGIQLLAQTNGGETRNTIAFGSYLGALFLLWLNMESRAAGIRGVEVYTRIQELEATVRKTQAESQGTDDSKLAESTSLERDPSPVSSSKAS